MQPPNINQFTDTRTHTHTHTHTHFQVVCRKARALLFLNHCVEQHRSTYSVTKQKYIKEPLTASTL